MNEKQRVVPLEWVEAQEELTEVLPQVAEDLGSTNSGRVWTRGEILQHLRADDWVGRFIFHDAINNAKHDIRKRDAKNPNPTDEQAYKESLIFIRFNTQLLREALEKTT